MLEHIDHSKVILAQKISTKIGYNIKINTGIVELAPDAAKNQWVTNKNCLKKLSEFDAHRLSITA